jgi:hypothetical protein
MRDETVDWHGLSPQHSEIVAASDSGERFYGFGEMFTGLDQAGKKGVGGDTHA